MTKKLYVDNRTVLRDQYFYLMRKLVRLGSQFPELEDVDPDDPKVEKLLTEFNDVATEIDQLTELINGFPDIPPIRIGH
jgi:hypothetical protein